MLKTLDRIDLILLSNPDQARSDFDILVMSRNIGVGMVNPLCVMLKT